MTNQSDRQATVRASTGTALTYDGDWHALFDQAGIATGGFDGRLLAWINLQLGSAYAEVNGAMAAFAASQNAPSWSAMGTFTTGGSPYPSQTQALLAANAAIAPFTSA